MKLILPYTKENRDYFARQYDVYFNTGEMTVNKGKYILIDGDKLYRAKNYIYIDIPDKPYKQKHIDGYEYEFDMYICTLSELVKHHGFKKIDSYSDIE